MYKNALRIVQYIIVLLGLIILLFLVIEPHFEGRNDNASVYTIYFNDPFLLFVYVASIPFFVGLYNAYKVTGRLSRGQSASSNTVRSIRIIKNCAYLTIIFALCGQIIILQNSSDDRAGGIFMGNLVILFSLLTAIFSARAEKRLQKSIKIEN